MVTLRNAGSPIDQYLRFRKLIRQALQRIPRQVLQRMPIINFETRPSFRVNDILATHSAPPEEAYFARKVNGVNVRRPDYIIHHNISLGTRFLSLYSDDAILSVVAHEVAHGWLDELGLSEHDENEDEADDMARKWGFGSGLDAFRKESKILIECGLIPPNSNVT